MTKPRKPPCAEGQEVDHRGEDEQGRRERAHPAQAAPALGVGRRVGGDHATVRPGRRRGSWSSPRFSPTGGRDATMAPMPRTVITFGTFDVFHVGHLRMIERAAALRRPPRRRRLGRRDSTCARRAGSPSSARRADGDRRGAQAGRRGVRRGEPRAQAALHRGVRRGRARDGRRLGRPVRRVRGHLRGRLPPPHPGDLHDRTDREDLSHDLTAGRSSVGRAAAARAPARPERRSPRPLRAPHHRGAPRPTRGTARRSRSPPDPSRGPAGTPAAGAAGRCRRRPLPRPGWRRLELARTEHTPGQDQLAEPRCDPLHLVLHPVGEALPVVGLPDPAHPASDAAGVVDHLLGHVAVEPAALGPAGDRVGSVVVIWPSSRNGSDGTSPAATWPRDRTSASGDGETCTVPGARSAAPPRGRARRGRHRP